MISLEELKQFNIFEDLPSDMLEEIQKIASYKEFKENSIIKKEGEASDDFYVIKEGKVAFETNLYGDKIVRLDTAEEQEYFGETSLIPPYKSFTTRRTIENSVMISINGGKLRLLLDKHPKLGHMIMKKLTMMLSDRLHRTRESLIHCHFS